MSDQPPPSVSKVIAAAATGLALLALGALAGSNMKPQNHETQEVKAIPSHPSRLEFVNPAQINIFQDSRAKMPYLTIWTEGPIKIDSFLEDTTIEVRETN